MEPRARADWFLCDVANVEIPVTEQLISAAVEAAMKWLKVGGWPTWEKWSLLSDTSRDAFLIAKERLQVREELDV